MSVTVIIVSYKSDFRIGNCLKKIGKKYNKIVIETSKDLKLKNYLEKKFNKTRVILSNNIGYGAAMNLGVKQARTKYIFMTTPDIILKNDTLQNLLNCAKKLNDKFSFLSPVTKNYKDKSIIEVKTCEGYAIFTDKQKFLKMGGWDENFFLFYEDHDLCIRFNKTNKKIYLVPSAVVKHYVGGFYKNDTINEIDICKNWHYMWSKYYFNKKYNGAIFGLISTMPALLRSFIKFLFYYFFDKNKTRKYHARASGLLNAYFNKKSWYRPFVS